MKTAETPRTNAQASAERLHGGDDECAEADGAKVGDERVVEAGAHRRGGRLDVGGDASAGA